MIYTYVVEEISFKNMFWGDGFSQYTNRTAIIQFAIFTSIDSNLTEVSFIFRQILFVRFYDSNLKILPNLFHCCQGAKSSATFLKNGQTEHISGNRIFVQKFS